MRIAKEEVPVKIDAPGAVARQQTDFGDATGFGRMGGEYFSLGKGADIRELLHGLEGNLCQCPHWGYMIKGQLTVTFSDGKEEQPVGGDLFYWPPGHSVRADEDCEVILFSPQAEHTKVIDHLRAKMLG